MPWSSVSILWPQFWHFPHVPVASICCLKLWGITMQVPHKTTLPMTYNSPLTGKYLTHSMLFQSSSWKQRLTSHSSALWWECSSTSRVVMAFGVPTEHILLQCYSFCPLVDCDNSSIETGHLLCSHYQACIQKCNQKLGYTVHSVQCGWGSWLLGIQKFQWLVICHKVKFDLYR